MTEREELARGQAIGVSEQGIGFLEPALVHQIDRQICEDRRARASERKGAAKMPLAGRKIVELRQDGAEVLMRERIARIDAERLSGELLGLSAPAVVKQQRDELGVGPVGVRVRLDCFRQYLDCLRQFATCTKLACPPNQDLRCVDHIGPQSTEVATTGAVADRCRSPD